MRTEGVIYNSFQDAVTTIHNVMKKHDAIDFQKYASADSSKGYLFEVTFQKPDVQIGRRLVRNYYYIKWENSAAFYTIWREAEELQNARDGGKTFNSNILSRIQDYSPLALIFADPHGIRIIDYEFFMLDSVEFKQGYNGEKVRGIDIRKLIPITEYFANASKSK